MDSEEQPIISEVHNSNEGHAEESRSEDCKSQILEFGAERSQMFSDAIFSIIATILVVSIKTTEAGPSKEGVMELKPLIIDSIPQFVAYFGCFFVVTAYWGCHVRLYNLITTTHDFTVWLNLLLLCVISFLPLTLSLWSHAKDAKEVIAHIPTINLLLAGLLFTTMIIYVFHSHNCIRTMTPIQKTQRRFIILMYTWFPTIIGVFCIYIYKLQEFALCFLFILILLSGYVIARFERWYVGHNIIDIALNQLHNPLPLCRIEAFSDGVYGISMTFMAVQTGEKFSEFRDSASFMKLFAKCSLTYLCAFGSVAILWFVHHQICNNLSRSNSVLQTINTLALSFVGGVTYSSSLIQHYTNPESESEFFFIRNMGTAVRLHCLVLFFSGIFQSVVWLAALYMQCQNVSHDYYSDVVIFFKTLVMPIISAVVYFSSLLIPNSAILLYFFLALCVPGIFSAINYVHRKKWLPELKTLMNVNL